MVATRRAAVYLDKGGTGKTTTVAHHGVAIANHGHDVLLLDLAGKQNDLAKQFGVYDDLEPDDDRWPNIATVFQPEWSSIVDQLGPEAALDKLKVDTGEGPDLIPAHQGLDSLDVELESKFTGAAKYERLDSFLSEYVDPHYDVVLFDLPGAPNNVTYNGVFAAGHVFAPVEAGPFEFEQAKTLQADVSRMRENFGADVRVAMIVLNKVDSRTSMADEYEAKYAEEFGSLMAPEPIVQSQDIRNAADGGATAFGLTEPSSTAEQARKAIETNAAELLERVSNE